MENLIKNEFKITSILVNGFYTDYLTASLIEQFKNKRVMLWQDKNLYHSCKRFQLLFGHDLIFLLEHFADEFDVLIVDKIRDKINPEGTINFIKAVTQMDKMKDKQFIFLFSRVSRKDNAQISDFENLKDVILEYSDNIYTFYRTSKFCVYGSKYLLQNIETKETFLLGEKTIGSKTVLEKIYE